MGPSDPSWRTVMSTEKRRGAVANGDAANDVELAPAQSAENGASDGGGAVKG